MPYKLIKGEFHIWYPDDPRRGPEPDGDTITFKPDNPALVESLQKPGNPGPNFNSRGMVSIRFDAIDALETHYKNFHQNELWSIAARDFMIRQMGFGEVRFYANLPYKVENAELHPVRGYIISKDIESQGRVVGFVFPGDTEFVDGAEVFADADFIENSVNAKLLEEGLVYPTFYSTLPVDLVEPLKKKAKAARKTGKGLWPQNDADNGSQISNLTDLQKLALFPKLFRRLTAYFLAGYPNLSHFEAWLRSDPVGRDDQLILPSYELGNMHDIFEISGDTLSLNAEIEELIVLPDGATAVVVPPAPVKPVAKEKSVRIIAALANPPGSDNNKELVTLLNVTPDVVDLTDWAIADKSNKRDVLAGILNPGQALQITLSGRVKLNNSGDTITLFNAVGKQIDQVSFDKKAGALDGWTLLLSEGLR